MDSGNHGVFQVKGNQEHLHQDCRLIAREEKYDDMFHAHAEKGHGRIEERIVHVWHDFVPTDAEWNGLFADLIRVTRKVATLDTKTNSWKESEEEIAFFLSTTVLPASAYMQHIRGHWRIENAQHNVRDNALREDASRIRKNPHKIARLRSFALNICRANGTKNIAATLYDNALCLTDLLKWKYIC